MALLERAPERSLADLGAREEGCSLAATGPIVIRGIEYVPARGILARRPGVPCRAELSRRPERYLPPGFQRRLVGRDACQRVPRQRLGAGGGGRTRRRRLYRVGHLRQGNYDIAFRSYEKASCHPFSR